MQTELVRGATGSVIAKLVPAVIVLTYGVINDPILVGGVVHPEAAVL
jgi:hypothetical protein